MASLERGARARAHRGGEPAQGGVAGIGPSGDLGAHAPQGLPAPFARALGLGVRATHDLCALRVGIGDRERARCPVPAISSRCCAVAAAVSSHAPSPKGSGQRRRRRGVPRSPHDPDPPGRARCRQGSRRCLRHTASSQARTPARTTMNGARGRARTAGHRAPTTRRCCWRRGRRPAGLVRGLRRPRADPGRDGGGHLRLRSGARPDRDARRRPRARPLPDPNRRQGPRARHALLSDIVMLKLALALPVAIGWRCYGLLGYGGTPRRRSTC